MRPHLFEAFGLFMPSYLAFQILAIAVAAIWVHRQRERFELPSQVGLDIALLGLVCVFVGGRIESLRRTATLELELSQSLLSMHSGGFAFFGVLWMGVLGTAAYALYHRRNVIELWDALAPLVPLALAVYRVGCLLAGCCYGTATDLPWGIVYPDTWVRGQPGVPVHPVPVYELIGGLTVFALLREQQDRHPPTGEVVLCFFVLVGGLRFVTDMFRGDVAIRTASWIPGIELTHAQWWCLLAGLFSLTVLIVRRARGASKPEA